MIDVIFEWSICQLEHNLTSLFLAFIFTNIYTLKQVQCYFFCLIWSQMFQRKDLISQLVVCTNLWLSAQIVTNTNKCKTIINTGKLYIPPFHFWYIPPQSERWKMFILLTYFRSHSLWLNSYCITISCNISELFIILLSAVLIIFISCVIWGNVFQEIVINNRVKYTLSQSKTSTRRYCDWGSLTASLKFSFHMGFKVFFFTVVFLAGSLSPLRLSLA